MFGLVFPQTINYLPLLNPGFKTKTVHGKLQVERKRLIFVIDNPTE